MLRPTRHHHRFLVSLLLRCTEKTSKARCCERVTDTVAQRARVKIPLSLPDICIGNHKSVAQDHAGFPRALRGSNSTGEEKKSARVCGCVCVHVCVSACAVCRAHAVVSPFSRLWIFYFFLQQSHLFLFICNRVSCGFHSEKSRGKTDDLQQVAMAVNKHLMRAGGFFFFFPKAWQPNETPGESNRQKKTLVWGWGEGWAGGGGCSWMVPRLLVQRQVFQISGKKKGKKARKESESGCFQGWT